MTEDTNQTIAILREMVPAIRQLFLLETLERLLEVAKDDDAFKFLPLLKSIANYASAQIATSEQSKELNSIFSLIASLEQKERELQ